MSFLSLIIFLLLLVYNALSKRLLELEPSKTPSTCDCKCNDLTSTSSNAFQQESELEAHPIFAQLPNKQNNIYKAIFTLPENKKINWSFLIDTQTSMLSLSIKFQENTTVSIAFNNNNYIRSCNGQYRQ